MFGLDHHLSLDLLSLGVGFDMVLPRLVVGHFHHLRRVDLGVYAGMPGVGLDSLACLRSLGPCHRVRLPDMGIHSGCLVFDLVHYSPISGADGIFRE